MSIETLSLGMIFCEGFCIVTVRKDTRTICWAGTKIKVSPAPRTPSNFPRRKTTPRSYCRNTRIEPTTYKIIASTRIKSQYMRGPLPFKSADHPGVDKFQFQD